MHALSYHIYNLRYKDNGSTAALLKFEGLPNLTLFKKTEKIF